DQPRGRTRPGPWTSSTISSQPDAGCGCSRSLTRSRASRPQSNLGSASALLMLWRYSNRSADKSGSLKAIRVDQGSEFVSRDLDLWAYQRGVTLDFSRPGKPTDNAFIESFNGKFRAECLNAHWFMSLDDAATSQRDRQQSPGRTDRPVSGTRPALTGAT